MQAPYLTSNKAIFYLICTFFIFSSCIRKNDTEVIKAMEESLINSNRTIDFSNQQILITMQDKLEDPVTKERAMVWFPVSKQIQAYSSGINIFIEQLKKEKRITSEQSNALYKELKNYKSNVLNVDSSIKKEFEHTTTIITRQFDSLDLKEADFIKSFFTNLSNNSIHAVLTKFQNNVSIVENKLLIYCHSMTASHIIIDDFPTALVGQNSKNFKQGDEVVITAGIGNVRRMTKEEIMIGGSIIPIRETGFAVYKLKANGIGIHYLPVQFSYLNANGKNETQEVTIEYTVTKPCDQ